jgi:hypothetical protein
MPSPFLSASEVGQWKSLPSVEPWQCWACGALGLRPYASIFTVSLLPSTLRNAVPEAPESLSCLRSI